MKSKKILIIIVLIAIVVVVFIYFTNSNKISEIGGNIGFFEQMVSIENYELFKNGSFDKLTENYKEYFTDRGLKIVFSNRENRYNYNFIEKYNIKSYKDLKAELLKESADGDTIYKDYKITYTYIDDKNKEYEINDYYKLNIIENKIDYIKLDTKRSTVVENDN